MLQWICFLNSILLLGIGITSLSLKARWWIFVSVIFFYGEITEILKNLCRPKNWWKNEKNAYLPHLNETKDSFNVSWFINSTNKYKNDSFNIHNSKKIEIFLVFVDLLQIPISPYTFSYWKRKSLFLDLHLYWKLFRCILHWILMWFNVSQLIFNQFSKTTLFLQKCNFV